MSGTTLEHAPIGSTDVEKEVLRRLRSVLDLMHDREAIRSPDCGNLSAAEKNHRLTAAAKAMYQARRRRHRHFTMLARDFGEPVWDMMLDLFVAGREKRLVSVSSACIAAAVPPTTALRWLQHLEDQAIIVREGDPNDRRRAHVRLSEPIVAAMERYITELVGNAGAG